MGWLLQAAETVDGKLLHCKLRRKKSKTLGAASSDDLASPVGVPPTPPSRPETGCVNLPCQLGTISGRPARCPALGYFRNSTGYAKFSILRRSNMASAMRVEGQTWSSSPEIRQIGPCVCST